MFEIKKQILIKRGIKQLNLSHYFRFNRYTEIQDQQISAEWLNYKKSHPDLYGPPSMKNNSTYEDCIFIKYFLETNTLEIVYHDGDSLHGYPTEPRCKWVFKVPETAVKLLAEIENHFDAKLLHVAECIHEKQREEMKKRNIQKILKILLTPE